MPLASGLLSGKYTTETTFAENDHRTFNRHGEAFDQGETFSGVDFETGVDGGAQEFAASVPEGVTVPQAALAWIVDQPGVSTVIPGARNVDQARANAAAGDVQLDEGLDSEVVRIYEKYFRDEIHARW